MKLLFLSQIILFLIICFNYSSSCKTKGNIKVDGSNTIIYPVQEYPELIGGLKAFYNNIYYPKELAEKKL